MGDEQPTLSVATYDLNSVDVLRSEAYASIAYGNLSVWSKRVTAMCKRLLRFEGTQIAPSDAPVPDGARALLLNAMNVAPEAEDDFNAWYDEEHLVALARVPGTLAARRYRSTEAGGGTHRYAQSITWRRRTWHGAPRGRPLPIRHGAPGCARTSATASVS